MRSMVLLVSFLTISCATSQPLRADCDRVRILFPAKGMILPAQGQVSIIADLAPPAVLSAPVRSRITARRRGDAEIVIAEGDIRSFSQPNLVRGIWQTSQAPPGEYSIRVSIEGFQPAEVGVRVHPVPVGTDIRLVSHVVSEGGTDVTLEAVASASAAIARYVWSAGDGSAAEMTDSPRFSHRYRAGRSHVVSVEVQDAVGGVALIERDLDVPLETDRPPTVRQTAECGCKVMEIVAKGTPSKTYCVPTVDDAVPEGTLLMLLLLRCTASGDAGTGGCPVSQIPFICPLGTRSPPPLVGWGFEVRARLTDMTNRQASCTQGQYARGTNRFNGFPSPNPMVVPPPPPAGIGQNLPDGAGGGGGFNFDVVAAGNGYPPATGPQYGPDDYAIPSLFKRHVPGEFYWYDQPSGRSGEAISMTQNKVFIAFVRGNPTCWCRFILKQEWEPGLMFADIAILDGQNCVAGEGVEDRR